MDPFWLDNAYHYCEPRSSAATSGCCVEVKKDSVQGGCTRVGWSLGGSRCPWSRVADESVTEAT